jgi:hypothetical protein
MNWKGCGWKQLCPILMYYLSICGGTEEYLEGSQCPNQDLNEAYAENKSVSITT